MKLVATPPDERNRLVASHKDASDAYDRALMTLSAGALGLSVGFVKDIAKNPESKWLILTGWVLLGLALACVVTSFALSVDVHRRVIAGLDAERPYDDEPRWVREGVTWLNFIAG